MITHQHISPSGHGVPIAQVLPLIVFPLHAGRPHRVTYPFSFGPNLSRTNFVFGSATSGTIACPSGIYSLSISCIVDPDLSPFVETFSVTFSTFLFLEGKGFHVFGSDVLFSFFCCSRYPVQIEQVNQHRPSPVPPDRTPSSFPGL